MSMNRDARCEMRDARCEMRDARCEMRDARCEMRDARCEMRDARCEMPDARCERSMFLELLDIGFAELRELRDPLELQINSTAKGR
jgi:uncharacterized protein (DUF3084 family)